ncbi:hypothetical protein FHG87_014893 [Trinorchestia longiramus]|nr:hypothetical protein FHG87_014893 [Trinorchestia longiramus]
MSYDGKYCQSIRKKAKNWPKITKWPNAKSQNQVLLKSPELTSGRKPTRTNPDERPSPLYTCAQSAHFYSPPSIPFVSPLYLGTPCAKLSQIFPIGTDLAEKGQSGSPDMQVPVRQSGLSDSYLLPSKCSPPFNMDNGTKLTSLCSQACIQKKEIEKLAKDDGLNEWNGKTTLIWYASKNVPRFEMFYDRSFGSQLLFTVRCKALSVNRRTWRWNEGNTRLCLQCNRGVEETVEHLVLECSKYEQEQESLMDVVHEQCGENGWNARCGEEESGMRYLVGLDEECNMTFVDAMKDFLVHAWNKRQ